MTTRRYTMTPAALAQRQAASGSQGPSHGRHSIRVPGRIYRRLLALRTADRPIWRVIEHALGCLPECSRLSTAVRTNGDGTADRTAD